LLAFKDFKSPQVEFSGLAAFSSFSLNLPAKLVQRLQFIIAVQYLYDFRRLPKWDWRPGASKAWREKDLKYGEGF